MNRAKTCVIWHRLWDLPIRRVIFRLPIESQRSLEGRLAPCVSAGQPADGCKGIRLGSARRYPRRTSINRAFVDHLSTYRNIFSHELRSSSCTLKARRGKSATSLLGAEEGGFPLSERQSGLDSRIGGPREADRCTSPGSVVLALVRRLIYVFV